MDINEICKNFYAKHEDAEKTADQMLSELNEKLRASLPYATYTEIEELMTETFNKKEQECFRDGFSMGLSHIIKALAFANSKMV